MATKTNTKTKMKKVRVDFPILETIPEAYAEESEKVKDTLTQQITIIQQQPIQQEPIIQVIQESIEEPEEKEKEPTIEEPTPTQAIPNYVSQVSLEYLMNREQYSRYQQKRKEINKKDRKFYKRRIYDLTRQLLNNEKPEILMPDVATAFDHYAGVCIEYFKVLDRTDILQEGYRDCDLGNLVINQDNHPHSEQPQYQPQDQNQWLMRQTKVVKTPTLYDNFIKRKPKPVTQMFIPQEKEIDLKAPDLKNKGIRKKKNIIHN